MHEVEELLGAPNRARVESVELVFIKINKNILSLLIESPEASLWPPQNDKRLYRLLRSTDPSEDRQLTPSLHNTLNALPDAMSVAVAKPLKVQDWGSGNASTLDMKTPYATPVRGLGSQDDEEVYMSCWN